jgi:hypothetical protein
MSTSSAKIIIKSTDMMDEMIEDAKKITSEAFNNAQQNIGKLLLTLNFFLAQMAIVNKRLYSHFFVTLQWKEISPRI